MKIYVCVKHVPDTAAAINVIEDRAIDEESTYFIINPYDEHCLTEASKIKDQFEGSEVIAVCLGKESAKDMLRSAMAMGADRSILIKTDQKPDAVITARALKAAIDEDGEADLILTGRESIDSGGMQIMFRLGALFPMPVMNNVVKVSIDGGRAEVSCDAERGEKINYSLDLPCVLGAAKGLNKPRYPTIQDIVKSKKKELKVIQFGDLPLDRSASALELIKLEPYVEHRTPQEIDGDPGQVAEKIIDILRNEAKVIVTI